MCELCSGEFEHKLTIEIGRAAMLRQRLDDFGPLHVVIEDANVEDDHIVSAMAEEISDEERAFCLMFMELSEGDRISALALAANLYGAESIHARR